MGEIIKLTIYSTMEPKNLTCHDVYVRSEEIKAVSDISDRGGCGVYFCGSWHPCTNSTKAVCGAMKK